jgi:AraC-like DNA-binding protein
LLERHGVDPARLDLPVAELKSAHARIDVSTVDCLVEAAASLLGPGGLGLKIAAVVDEDTYGEAGRVMLGAGTLREAFELAFRHQRLWGDTERFSMRQNAHALRLAFKHPGKSPLARAVLAELALVELIAGARRLVSPEAAASRVSFSHGPLEDPSALEAVFGCAVMFGARANELVFPRALVEAPLAVPKELLRAALERDAERAEATLPPHAITTADRVRAVAGDFPALPELAMRLRLSTRTLQRRLHLEGSSYFALIDEARRATVDRLASQGLSEKRIAFEVGFCDERALARARARWAP